MSIKNSIAFGVAATAGVIGPALIFGAICTSPTLGVSGAAAFTTALSSLGVIISLPTLFGGLLSLLILDAIICLIVYLLMQIQLAWLPV